jgi:predicted small metal-binding protein
MSAGWASCWISSALTAARQREWGGTDTEGRAMRVVECNFCGEVLSAANDDELAQEVRRHMGDQHADASIDEQRARDMVERDAYSATDS